MRKPLIERKRRERINTCLDQLKETVIGAFRLDVSVSELPVFSFCNDANCWTPPILLLIIAFFLIVEQQSKLEKADILEMTVKHLQNLQGHKRNGEKLDSGSDRPVPPASGVVLFIYNLH